jgi:hypothetical protein
MKVAEFSLSGGILNACRQNDALENNRVQLVLAFGAKPVLATGSVHPLIRQAFPNAEIVLCSTSGEIFHDTVLDNTVSVTALQFDQTTVKTGSVNIADYPNSHEAGVSLMESIGHMEDLCYIMIISDGSMVNGSELVSGIESIVRHKVPVTGGLAGDGANFMSTLTGLNADPLPGLIVAIAFGGKHLRVSHGSMGGWEMFGPERTVTRSQSNQLFELNGENALDIYRKYLGRYAEDLPGSALLFPLSVKLADRDQSLVRTILSIDNESKSMVFAGDVPEGSRVRLMKANFDKLINAASEAAGQTLKNAGSAEPKLALLISCVGRRLVLNARTGEEVEAVRDALGGKTLLTGFYSYGEISPLSRNMNCELHNQTMTITTFDEQ